MSTLTSVSRASGVGASNCGCVLACQTRLSVASARGRHVSPSNSTISLSAHTPNWMCFNSEFVSKALIISSQKCIPQSFGSYSDRGGSSASRPAQPAASRRRCLRSTDLHSLCADVSSAGRPTDGRQEAETETRQLGQAALGLRLSAESGQPLLLLPLHHLLAGSLRRAHQQRQPVNASATFRSRQSDEARPGHGTGCLVGVISARQRLPDARTYKPPTRRPSRGHCLHASHFVDRYVTGCSCCYAIGRRPASVTSAVGRTDQLRRLGS
ncbi:unnamed protein product, partial [Protopolystoma xenopodis]